MTKKTMGIIFATVVVIVLAVIGIIFVVKDKSNNKNIEGSLEEIMTKLYENLPEDDVPFLGNTEVTPENIDYYLGTADIDYAEALASEPFMSSIAHSVVLVRLNNVNDAKEVKEKITNNVNPAKWICVEVERQNVKVVSRGNLVALIMDNELADKILDNFNNL